MQLPNDSLTRPTLNTSPTIFNLKYFNLVCTAWSIKYFCYFINSNLADFITRCPSRHQPSLVTGTSIFIETPSLGHRQPRLKSDSPANEMETISCQTSDWYFKRPPGWKCVLPETTHFLMKILQWSLKWVSKTWFKVSLYNPALLIQKWRVYVEYLQVILENFLLCHLTDVHLNADKFIKTIFMLSLGARDLWKYLGMSET